MNTVAQDRLGQHNETTADDNGTARCRCCRELIQADAQLCPHCRSSQLPPSKLQLGLNSLKWAGAATAILSLVALSIQLTGFFEESRNRRRTVMQYINAAERLRTNKDLAGALEMLEEALQLAPTNPDANRLQLSTAMQKIRHYAETMTNEDWDENIAPLISKIRRGVGHKDPAQAAAVRAHMAWAHSLLDMRHPAIVTIFNDALSADPRNAFVNALWGGWCVRAYRNSSSLAKACGDEPLRTATTHFQYALKDKKTSALVGSIAFQTLLPRNGARSTEAIIEALFLANDLAARDLEDVIANRYILFEELCNKLDFGDNEAALLKRISPVDLINIIPKIFPDPQDKSYLNELVSARLQALAGDRDRALKELKTLRIRVRRLMRHGISDYYPDGHPATYYIDKALVHILGLKTGRLGIQVESAESDERGVRVLEVEAGGPADQVGLRPGDQILTAADAEVNNRFDLHRLLVPLPPGETLPLSVQRKNKTLQIIVTLGSGGDPLTIPAAWSADLYRIVNRRLYHLTEVYCGFGDVLQLTEINSDFRTAYAIDNNLQGAINLELYNDGRVSISPGDVIAEIDHKSVEAPRDIATAVRAAIENGRTEVSLLISGIRGLEFKKLQVR